MRNAFCFPVVALIAVVLLPQSVNAEPSPIKAEISVTRDSETGMLVVNVANATVEQYVRALARVHVEGDCQVFCTNAVRDSILPTISNLKCHSRGAARILPALTKNSSVPLSVEKVEANSDIPDEVLVIDIVVDPAKYLEQKEHVRVVNVKAQIEAVGGDENLHSIIQSGLSATELAGPTLRLKLHEESNLLFIRGTEEQLDFVGMLLGELTVE